jgi:phenylpyruvate tautomerase PptA (4-oxalocrotonate tautomerase family)
MPIEIKELQIKAIVSDSKKDILKGSLSASDLMKLKQEIISEVTENVFRTLRQKNER